MDGADGERPLPRRRGCAASNLSIRRFSLPGVKAWQTQSIVPTCAHPRGADADPTEGGGGKEARNDSRRIVVDVNAALRLFIDMRGLVASLQ